MMKALTAQARRNLLRRRESILGMVTAHTGNGQGNGTGLNADWLDQSAARAYQDMGGRLAERELQELREIDAALRRMDQGSWGRCLRCGGPIGRQRLQALPEARECLGCRALAETRP